MHFTDAQLVLLSAAAQRDDALLPRPDKLAGAALTRMEAALVKAGAVEPVPVRADQPSWRKDDAETPVGLRITAAGLVALGIEPPTTGDADDAAAEPVKPRRTRATSDTAPSFRPGTKLAQLVALLSTTDGIGIEGLVAALCWQPHTIRAALTRLRQGGLAVARSKDERNKTVYRILSAAESGRDASVSTNADAA